MAVKSRKQSKTKRATRTHKVWATLLAAMTGVGGLLIVLNGRPVPGSEGMTLTPLMAMRAPGTLESVFQTAKPVERDRWLSIVIHDSGRATGSPKSLETEARAMKLKGLGYHFVIGNGNGMGDGELHVGARWLRQEPGAHVVGREAEWYNLNSIGICLVGDGERQDFTSLQMEQLHRLVNTLSRELGVPAEKIVLHRDIARTASPGRHFPETAFRAGMTTGR
jgi:hypothetical protein